MTNTALWMSLKDTILNEINQPNKYGIIPLTGNTWNRKIQTKSRVMVIKESRGWEDGIVTA